MKQTHKLDLKPCLRKLIAANAITIEVKGVDRVPVVIGSKSYEHDFCVLGQSEAGCLQGLDFLETNKFDQIFSCTKITITFKQLCSLSHKQFENRHDNVFRVSSTETRSVPPGHRRIIPVLKPNWKRPPIQVCAQFEPKDKFEPNIEVSAPNVLFDFTEEVIPRTIDRKLNKK